jgi:hypothetical protein
VRKILCDPRSRSWTTVPESYGYLRSIQHFDAALGGSKRIPVTPECGLCRNLSMRSGWPFGSLQGQTQEVRIEGASRTHAATKGRQSAQSRNDLLTACIGKSQEISANNARSWKATTNAQFRTLKAAARVRIRWGHQIKPPVTRSNVSCICGRRQVQHQARSGQEQDGRPTTSSPRSRIGSPCGCSGIRRWRGRADWNSSDPDPSGRCH